MERASVRIMDNCRIRGVVGWLDEWVCGVVVDDGSGSILVRARIPHQNSSVPSARTPHHELVCFRQITIRGVECECCGVEFQEGNYQLPSI